MYKLESRFDWKKARGLALLTAALSFVLLPGADPRPAGAQEQPAGAGAVLRLGCVAPRGSAWHRVYTAWGNTLRSATQGRLSLEVRAGLAEADLLTQMRRNGASDVDGGAVSALGLGSLGRDGAPSRALVLQAPGLFTEYAPLDRARTALDGELRTALGEGGVELMGWSDFGRGRIFSTHPIATPADLRAAHLWLPPSEVVSGAFAGVLGVTGQASPLAGVRDHITAGRIDTVVASPMAVGALRWSERLQHVSSQPTSVLIGATVLSATEVSALPADLQEQLRTTGARAHETLQRTIRRDDDAAYQSLVTRDHLTPFTMGATAEWDALATQARARLVSGHGTGASRTPPVFSQELLNRVMAAR